MYKRFCMLCESWIPKLPSELRIWNQLKSYSKSQSFFRLVSKSVVRSDSEGLSSMRNWGLVKAFLRTNILRFFLRMWFLCCGFVCLFACLFLNLGCAFHHHSSFGWCTVKFRVTDNNNFLWEKVLMKSCWKTELNWGKSVKGSQMIITSSHIHF